MKHDNREILFVASTSRISHALAGSVGFAPIPPPHDVRRGAAAVGLARAGQLSRGEGFRDVEDIDRGAGQAEECCTRQLPCETNASIIGFVVFVFADNGTSQGYEHFPARIAHISIPDSRGQGFGRSPVGSEGCSLQVIGAWYSFRCKVTYSLELWVVLQLFTVSALTRGPTRATATPRSLLVAGTGRPRQGVSTDDGARTPPNKGYQERHGEARGDGSGDQHPDGYAG